MERRPLPDHTLLGPCFGDAEPVGRVFRPDAAHRAKSRLFAEKKAEGNDRRWEQTPHLVQLYASMVSTTNYTCSS